MDLRYREILLDRPELVTSFPAWMLPAETVARLRAAATPCAAMITSAAK